MWEPLRLTILWPPWTVRGIALLFTHISLQKQLSDKFDKISYGLREKKQELCKLYRKLRDQVDVPLQIIIFPIFRNFPIVNALQIMPANGRMRLTICLLQFTFFMNFLNSYELCFRVCYFIDRFYDSFILEFGVLPKTISILPVVVHTMQ
jgi:hypothetical protein